MFILDSERIKEVSGLTMVHIYLFIFILYTKFLPERELRFQHIVSYILENWIKEIL